MVLIFFRLLSTFVFSKRAAPQFGHTPGGKTV